MSRSKWNANLDRLCQSLENYGKNEAGRVANDSAGTAAFLSESLFLAHSTSDGNFAAICASGQLLSSIRQAASRGESLPLKCAEVVLGTAGYVFFYVAPFRYPNTGCGLLFAKSLEFEHENGGVATPFDSGGLARMFIRADPAEPLREFLARHEMPIPEHRRCLKLSMEILFHEPRNYVDGSDPRRPGPIGLTGGDQRRWTHEVRIPDRVFLRGSHLQAAFAPKARIAADPDIESLFQWCATESVDNISFDSPRGNDFGALRRECLAYFRRKVN